MGRRRLLMDLTPVRASPAFRRVWLGSSLSMLGGQMTSFAIALQVYTMTRSSIAVGGVGLAVAVPAILFGLFGGVIADSVDRRRVAVATSIGLAGISVILVLQAFAGFGQLWLLYCLVAAQSLIGSVAGPVQRTFLATLLPADRVAAGAALNMFAVHISVTAGPVLAGLITAGWGLRACYVVDLITFAAALYALVRLPSMPPQGASRKPGIRSVGAGLSFIARHRVLPGAFLADINATVLGMPFALFPAVNAERFGGASETLGWLMAAPAIGGIIGTLLSGPIGRTSRQGRAILVSSSLWGASLVAFGMTHSLWLALLWLVVAGTADVISVVFRTAVIQVATPDQYRGRVSAAEYIVGAGLPHLGNFRAGAIGSLTSSTTSVVSGGLAVIGGVALVGLAFPAFRRYRSTACNQYAVSG